MKNIFSLIVSVLILSACDNDRDNSQNQKVETITKDKVVDVVEEVSAPKDDVIELKEGEFLVEAKFVYFSLGDASHYVFQDTNGVHWDFGSNSSQFSFAELLDESDMNTSNQGWGSNEEWVGKWFSLICSTDQREQYIDGPIGPVHIIVSAKESVFNKIAIRNNSGFELEMTKLKESENEFFFKSSTNPSGTIRFEFEELDPGSYAVKVLSEKLTYKFDDLYSTEGECYWPKKGKYVILNNIESYANSGTQNVYVLNVLTGNIIDLSFEHFQEGLKIGDREMLNIESISWLNSESFNVKGCFTYLGSSGHPGIDANRKNKLGKNFANRTDVRRFERTYTIIKDTSSSILNSNITPVKDIPLKSYIPTGQVKKQLVDHYVCYKGIYDNDQINVWVSFTKDDKAIQIKYENQKSPVDLVFENEKVYPNGTISTNYIAVLNGKIIGDYKLTHSGVWDYVSCVRAKDLKEFSFSIKHDGNPYGKTPCF